MADETPAQLQFDLDGDALTPDAVYRKRFPCSPRAMGRALEAQPAKPDANAPAAKAG